MIELDKKLLKVLQDTVDNPNDGPLMLSVDQVQGILDTVKALQTDNEEADDATRLAVNKIRSLQKKNADLKTWSRNTMQTLKTLYKNLP